MCEYTLDLYNFQWCAILIMHYLMLPVQRCAFSTVALLMPYCLLAFNVSFL